MITYVNWHDGILVYLTDIKSGRCYIYIVIQQAQQTLSLQLPLLTSLGQTILFYSMYDFNVHVDKPTGEQFEVARKLYIIHTAIFPPLFYEIPNLGLEVGIFIVNYGKLSTVKYV